MKVTFDNLISLKEILELAKKNLELQIRSVFYGNYFKDYLNSLKLFLESGPLFYKNAELTVPELEEYYTKDYEEYMGRR